MSVSLSGNLYSKSDYGMSAAGVGQTAASGASEISGVTSQTGSAEGKDVLAPGSTVSGEVVAKDGDTVTLKMAGNQLVEAKLTGNADINVGQRLSFEVAHSKGEQLALRPLYANLATNSAAVSALKAASLPVNNTTLAMTDRMMLEGMNINKNALTDMFKSVSTHPNASVETVVQMNKLNMPLTDANVTQFENYRNFEHRITGDIINLADGLTDALSDGISELTAGGGTDVIADVLGIIDSEVKGQPLSDDLLSQMKSILELDNMVEGSASETLPSAADESGMQQESNAVSGNVLLAESNLPSEIIGTNTGSGEFINLVKELINEYSGEIVLAGDVPETEEAAILDKKGIIQSGNRDNPAAESGNAGINGSDSGNTGINASRGEGKLPPLGRISFLPNSESSSIPELKTTGLGFDKGKTDIEAYDPEGKDGELKNNALLNAGEGSKTVSAGKNSDVAALLLKNIADLSDENTEELSEEQLREKVRNAIGQKLSRLIRSDGFKETVKDALKAQMSLEPSDVAKEGKIDELYARILKTSSKVITLMENLGKGDSVTAKAAANISDNVGFMNQLNEFVNYVQLPLKMAGENANGELYVYTKKKNLRDNDGNFSALLHLDMEHLGPMDVYVKMSNYTKVTTNFCLESEELLDFVEAHIDELTKRLTEKGYDTGVSVSKKGDGNNPTPIADEFTKNDEGIYPGFVSKMGFDVRA